MDTLMFTRTVIIIMDLMDMRLIMIMARDLLSLDMALLMFMFSRRIMDMVTLNPMNMDTTSIRDLLNQDMVITMDMDTLMFTRTVIIIMDLMDMRLIMIIRRDL